MTLQSTSMSAPNRARPSHRIVFAMVAMAAALFSAPSFAHQTFLLPGQFVWNKSEPVDVILTSALVFPNVEHGPAQDRIAFSRVHIAGEPVNDLTFRESETALSLSFSPTRSGLAVIAASSKPRAGEISPEDVDMYLDEIEADETVRQAFDALPGSPPLNRSYSKHAKTFLCIETCGDASSAETPVGQKLEFVSVGLGNKSYRLLLDGKPLARQSVTIAPADGEALKTSTGEDGSFKLSEPLSGVVMLAAVWITMPEQPDGIYHSDYATLTINLDQQP